MSSPYLPESNAITMFSTQWCGYCRSLKAMLEHENIPYTEIDIEQHPDAAEIVTGANGGNRTVPTVLFSDGTTATNPSITEVKKRR